MWLSSRLGSLAPAGSNRSLALMLIQPLCPTQAWWISLLQWEPAESQSGWWDRRTLHVQTYPAIPSIYTIHPSDGVSLCVPAQEASIAERRMLGTAQEWLLSNTQNELSRETHADKARLLLERVLVEGSRVWNKENCSATWLTASYFMGIGFVSRLSLTHHS